MYEEDGRCISRHECQECVCVCVLVLSNLLCNDSLLGSQPIHCFSCCERVKSVRGGIRGYISGYDRQQFISE